MNEHDPMQPYPGEAPLSLEFGLIMLAVGLVIFVYIVWKFVRDRRRRRRQQGDES